MSVPLPTLFAPAERADTRTLRAQHEAVANDALAGPLLDSFPEGAAILNHHRQIVFANQALASFSGHSREALVGQRLGEAFRCLHADDLPNGCGTTDACRYCGAARASESSRLNQSNEVQECRILRQPEADPPALDLRVWTKPIQINGQCFTVIALRDISDEKRRQSLERIFFHDLMNLAGGLRGLLENWGHHGENEAVVFERLALSQAEQLVEEISCQRDLGAAERGELAVHMKSVPVGELIEQICFLYKHHPVAVGKTFLVESATPHDSIYTDPVHLRRVLGNLIKNALEASVAGDVVTIRYQRGPEGPTFAIHNRVVLSEAVRQQVFQRSFSTKGGPGRGLGSYSVKLLTERYLRGRVDFRSVPGEGTTFRIVLPGASPTEVVVAPPADPIEGLPPFRALLADDNPVNRIASSALLRKLGATVTAVCDGTEALAAFESEAFDVVFMDVQMPQMDGLEATAQIRRLEENRSGRVPIVALTGDDSQESRAECHKAGMDAHLAKPLTGEAVFRLLTRLIRR